MTVTAAVRRGPAGRIELDRADAGIAPRRGDAGHGGEGRAAVEAHPERVIPADVDHIGVVRVFRDHLTDDGVAVAVAVRACDRKSGGLPVRPLIGGFQQRPDGGRRPIPPESPRWADHEVVAIATDVGRRQERCRHRCASL